MGRSKGWGRAIRGETCSQAKVGGWDEKKFHGDRGLEPERERLVHCGEGKGGKWCSVKNSKGEGVHLGHTEALGEKLALGFQVNGRD